MTPRFALLGLALLCTLTLIQALPTGAPNPACAPVQASASGHGQPQATSSPYTLEIDPPCGGYTAGQVYNVTLTAPADMTFRGFLIVARPMGADGSTNFLGTWDTMNSPDVQLTCVNQGGITHTSNSNKTIISAQWTAPPLGSGNIEFRFAVVQVRMTHWANQMGPVLADPTAIATGSAPPTSVGTKLFLGICATLMLVLSL